MGLDTVLGSTLQGGSSTSTSLAPRILPFTTINMLVGFDEGSEYLKALPLRNKTPVEVKRVYIRGYGWGTPPCEDHTV